MGIRLVGWDLMAFSTQIWLHHATQDQYILKNYTQLEGAQRVHISAKCHTFPNRPITNPSLLFTAATVIFDAIVAVFILNEK